MLDGTLKMEMWAQNAEPTVFIEANGDPGLILALMETGVEHCIQKVANELSGDATLQGKMIDSTIKLLNEHKQRILRRTKAPEETKKEPAKHMSPAEYSAFMDAWMSQATQAEKAELLRLVAGDFAKHISSL